MYFEEKSAKNWLNKNREKQISKVYRSARTAIIGYFLESSSTNDEKNFLKNFDCTHQETSAGADRYDQLLQEYCISLVLYMIVSSHCDSNAMTIRELFAKRVGKKATLSKEAVVKKVIGLYNSLRDDATFYTLIKESDFASINGTLLDEVSIYFDYTVEDDTDEAEEEQKQICEKIAGYKKLCTEDIEYTIYKICDVILDYKSNAECTRLKIHPVFLVPLWLFLEINSSQNRNYSYKANKCLNVLKEACDALPYFWEDNPPDEITSSTLSTGEKKSPEKFDYYRTLFLHDELYRLSRRIYSIRDPGVKKYIHSMEKCLYHYSAKDIKKRIENWEPNEFDLFQRDVYTAIERKSLCEIASLFNGLLAFDLILKKVRISNQVSAPIHCNDSLNIVLFDYITGLLNQVEEKLATESKFNADRFAINPIYRSSTSLKLSQWGWYLPKEDCEVINKIIDRLCPSSSEDPHDFLSRFNPFKGYISYLSERIIEHYTDLYIDGKKTPFAWNTSQNGIDCMEAIKQYRKIITRWSLDQPCQNDR